ncbi:hypothetical protein SAY87_012590 [Trapa incisa]|uniref:DUF7477 domain-containing protein n=1 Tax=Trapa incisa TaxID=236973 RepID=A0AAN7GK98_9MYRT|nr:hypothetical protein SAY87_012590 [Trapa incisa]
MSRPTEKRPTQSYKVSESFPFKWINKKWKEGFHVTSMTRAGSRWGVVMSRNSGYSDQVVDETQKTLRTSAFPSTHVKESGERTSADQDMLLAFP